MADTHLISDKARISHSRSASLRAATRGLVSRHLRTTRQTVQGQLIFVANEAGLGIIPQGALARRFVDEAGRLNQQLAQTAQQVTFIAAGLPLVLKGHQ